MTTFRLRSSLTVLAAWSLGASAHHAFDPLLDAEGEQTFAVIDGSVRVFRIVNPHGALIVNVTDESGATTPWLIELNPATQLAREGWTNDMVDAEDRVTVAVALSRQHNRGRLRALLVHPDDAEAPARLLVSYGIRGDTPVMRRLQERLPGCGILNEEYGRTACFLVDAAALRDLEQEFAGPMGYVMDNPE
ncbi:MAG TPA: DUF6152 family protein [Gammaproteobacteria bacterium]|nr:DUF6152 family protein [Gammaproteobacteria bacterium]